MPDVPVVKVGTAVFGSGAPTVVAALPVAESAARDAAAAGAAAVTGAGGRAAGLPVVADVAGPDEAERAAAHAAMLRLTAPDDRLVDAAAGTGLPVLLARGPGDDGGWLAAAGRLGRRGAAGVVLDVPAADLARAWSVRRRAALPVVVDLRRPRVVPALAAAVARAAFAAGADGVVVTPDGDAGIAGADLPDLAVLAVLAPLLTSDPAAEPGLAGLRHRLDLLDEQIVRLVAHRRAVARLVGAVKRRDRLPARDLRREVQVLDRAAALAGRLDADPRTVLAIFNLLIDDAVGAQRAVHTTRPPEERPR